MPKKIIFINPPYERIARGYDFLRHITNQSPSLGLLHLAAEVRLRGYQPSIIESDILNLSVEEVAHRVIEEKPAYVGITLFTVGVWGAGAIARKYLRERLGMEIRGYLSQLGPIALEAKDLSAVDENPFFCADPEKIPELEKVMDQLRDEGDSIGATAPECP